MNIVILDYETYFDDEYSLKKMTTEAYVRDPRFEVHGCAFRRELDGCSHPTEWIPGRDVKYYLEHCGIRVCAVLCHHAQFDGFILSHHYGVRPAAWLDTLSMARLMLGNHVSASLDSVARHFGLAAKTVPYELFRGKKWAELDAATQRLIADGACHDVDLTWQIFNLLMNGG